MRSDSNEDDGPLDFSLSMVLGLENPITLQGLTDTYDNMVLAIAESLLYLSILKIY